MANIALANPTVTVNNVNVAIVPNSFSYTEGLGEQNTRVQSAGGGSVQAVYSRNVETQLSSVKFSMINTVENINLIRTWKENQNENGISITGEGGFDRFIAEASLNNDYEVNLGADTTIDLEFMGRAAI